MRISCFRIRGATRHQPDQSRVNSATLGEHGKRRWPRREALRARIGRRFQIVEREWVVGPLRIPFVQIADPDVVLDEVAAEEDRLERVSGRRADGDQLHLPYWAELWDSAAGIG